MKLQRVVRLIAAIGLVSVGLSGGARAEVDTVRIAKQFGLGYLPLTLMEEQKLLAERAKKQGLDIKVEWLRLSAGAPMTDAILSGDLDFASEVVGPLLTIWGKTHSHVMGRASG